MTGIYMKRNTGLKWVKIVFSHISSNCIFVINVVAKKHRLVFSNIYKYFFNDNMDTRNDKVSCPKFTSNIKQI